MISSWGTFFFLIPRHRGNWASHFADFITCMQPDSQGTTPGARVVGHDGKS